MRHSHVNLSILKYTKKLVHIRWYYHFARLFLLRRCVLISLIGKLFTVQCSPFKKVAFEIEKKYVVFERDIYRLISVFYNILRNKYTSDGIIILFELLFLRRCVLSLLIGKMIKVQYSSYKKVYIKNVTNWENVAFTKKQIHIRWYNQFNKFFY